MNSDLPQYLAAFRRERRMEAFNQWVNLEANRQLRNTPVFHQQIRARRGKLNRANRQTRSCNPAQAKDYGEG